MSDWLDSISEKEKKKLEKKSSLTGFHPCWPS